MLIKSSANYQEAVATKCFDEAGNFKYKFLIRGYSDSNQKEYTAKISTVKITGIHCVRFPTVVSMHF